MQPPLSSLQCGQHATRLFRRLRQYFESHQTDLRRTCTSSALQRRINASKPSRRRSACRVLTTQEIKSQGGVLSLRPSTTPLETMSQCASRPVPCPSNEDSSPKAPYHGSNKAPRFGKAWPPWRCSLARGSFLQASVSRWRRTHSSGGCCAWAPWALWPPARLSVPCPASFADGSPPVSLSSRPTRGTGACT